MSVDLRQSSTRLTFLPLIVMNESNHKHVAAAMIAAFLLGGFRGARLLGWPTGIFLGACLAFAVFLAWDAFTNRERFTHLRQLFAAGFALFMLALIFVPTWISPSFQYTIDTIRDERNMHVELSDVLGSDDRFSLLTPTITQRKATSVDLHGSLPSTAALNDARDAIRERCPTVSSSALVSWHVDIAETGKRVELNDGRLDQWSGTSNIE